MQCYSKFGDVVFTLTRFFRDAGARGSTHLRLIQTENIGKYLPAKEHDQFHCFYDFYIYLCIPLEVSGKYICRLDIIFLRYLKFILSNYVTHCFMNVLRMRAFYTLCIADPKNIDVSVCSFGYQYIQNVKDSCLYG